LSEREVLFGELRSLLQRAPEPQTWGALCALLERWPDDGSLAEQALPYCEAQLRGWEDSWRVAPRRWIARVLSGDKLPALALARRLRVHVQLTDRDKMQRLIEHPALGHITQLDLAGTSLHEHMVGPLMERLAEHNRLRALDLSDNDVLGALDAWLQDEPDKPPLERLSLANVTRATSNNAQPMALPLVRLARAPLVRGLRHLDLSRNPLGVGGSAGLDALVEVADAAPVLESLWLEHCEGHHGLPCMHIFALSGWEALRHLSLRGNLFLHGGAHVLREAPAVLGRLKTLELGECRIDDATLDTLFEPLTEGHSWGLTALDLSDNPLTDQAVERLLALPWVGQLRLLNLSATQLTDAGALALITSPRLHPSARVVLNGNGFNEVTLAAIAASAAVRAELDEVGARWCAAALDPDDPWWMA
jgi:Ran GTPase-activating protein (RanGAP) involved in mRNA processing and transport